MWASLEQLRETATDYAVAVPVDDDAAQRALDAAGRDLEVHVLGVRDMPLDALTEGQTGALGRAEALQCCWRISMDDDDLLGVDDRITGVGDGVTFVARPTARVSPAAVAELALHGLVARTLTVGPEPPPEVPTWPWP
jgi:hypothetical protein